MATVSPEGLTDPAMGKVVDSARKACILVVDDLPASLVLLEKMLKRQGYEVHPVHTGLLALQSARNHPPDLILMDVSMPDMDGFETCAELKKDPQLADIPVLFISGHNETFDKVRAFAVGGVDYITRPFETEELLARMETHLKIFRLQRELDQHNKNMQERVLEQDQEILNAHAAADQAKADRTEKAEGQMNKALADGRRRILVTLRFLSLVIITSFLVFNPPPKSDETAAIILLALFLASILGMFFVYQSWLEKMNFLVLVFSVDTLFVTSGLYLSGIKQWDLMTMYFLTIFICALVKDVKNSVGVGVAACFIFLLLQYKMTGQWLIADTTTLLKLPFLLIVATFSGFLAADSRIREDMARRYGKINESISEQADMVTQKLLASERHLKELVRYYHLLLANIQTGIVVAHGDEKVRTFNVAASRITGLEESSVVGSSLEELPASFQPIANLMRRTLAEGKSFSQENVELDKQQPEPVYISLQSTLLQSPEAATLGVIATLKDVTLVKQMEQQLLRSERLANLGEMAAGVAHEIKNPMNAILGFSQRLSDKLTDPKLKNYANIIVEEVNRLGATINDVLEYNRTLVATKENMDLNAVLNDALLIVTEKAAASKVKIVREIDPGLPSIPMDKDKIKQVFLNLMFNALSAMETGGTLTVRVRVEDGMLPVDQMAKSELTHVQQIFFQKKMASISVRDTGCGIPKENIHKLFNPFFTTKTTGTGLGLSICHKIVESHGGFMRVESQVGAGSNFIFYLPLEEEKVAQTPIAAKERVDFNEILDGSLMIVAEKADASNVEIVRDIDPSLPPIPVDKDKIKQVLMNLMFNAINAMASGGTLTVRARVEEGLPPSVQADTPEMSHLQPSFFRKKMASITVKDTGRGIPEENIQKLFNPLLMTKTTGSGLGLSICQKIIESYGGGMRVESQVGVGSSFIFYLPLEEEAGNEAK